MTHWPSHRKVQWSVMADLDKCLDGLRSLARSSHWAKLIDAELLVHDLVLPVVGISFMVRTSLASLDDAIIQEAQQNPLNAEFWKNVQTIIASRLSDDY